MSEGSDSMLLTWNRKWFSTFLNMRVLPFHHVTISAGHGGKMQNIASVEEAGCRIPDAALARRKGQEVPISSTNMP